MFITATIVGSLLILLIIVLLIIFIVYRIRKRDEGSYMLDDPALLIGQSHSSSSGYRKGLMADQEFYA